MVATTLALLQTWYTEPSQGNDRPKLLSKLAVLEFCGWLEHWMDDFITELGGKCVCDPTWIADTVVGRTSGFDYNSHFRPMLCRILGEHHVIIGERRHAARYPADLDQIKSVLGSLWKTRCSFAHSDLVHNVQKAIVFDAPSMTQNQHRILEKRLDRFKEVFLELADQVPGT